MSENCSTASLLVSDIPQPNEGATDEGAYLAARGGLSALMIFVTFPNVPDPGYVAQPASLLLGQYISPGQTSAEVPWFGEESFGTATLEVHLADGYRPMPENSDQYNLGTDQRRYLQDAVDLYADLLTRTWDLLYVVPPPGATGMGYLGPAFAARAGDGYVPGSCPTCPEIRFGATFVPANYNTGLQLLIHETGHTFGLPDLYCAAESGEPTGKCQESGLEAEQAAGAWDVMSNGFYAQHLLAYHRFKLGWVGAESICSLASGSTVLNLSSLWVPGSVNAVLVPVSESGESKCYLVEVPIVEGSERQRGVLVYSVNANIVSGKGPVVVQMNGTRDNLLDTATLPVGGSFDNGQVEVVVEADAPDEYGFTVKVTNLQ